MQTFGIIWLASYPKSGNTWLRAFLANYMKNPDEPLAINDLVGYALGDGFVIHYERLTGKKAEDLTADDIDRLRPEVHEWFARSKGQTVFVKTHNLVGAAGGTPLITPSATAGAIYVVRNPLDVAVSYGHHFRTTMDAAVDALCRQNNVVEGGERALPQYLGSWWQHVRSWTEAPGLSPHVIRYEDMLNAPRPTFEALAAFLRWPPDSERIEKAIRFSAFDEMSRQERDVSFRETPAGATSAFFREGRAGTWQEALSGAQVERLVAANAAVMKRFGYLSPAGKPIPA